MNIFKNAYQELRQENIDNSIKLGKAYRKEIEEMMKYVSSNGIALFEVEILKKDLIGIAEEAKKEKQTMQEYLGVPKKEFCDSLIEGAMKKKPFEWLFLLVKNMVISIAVINTILFLSLGCPKEYGILSAATMAAIWEMMSEFIDSKIFGKYGLSDDDHKKMKFMQCFCVVSLLILLTIFSKINIALFVGNGWMITVIVLMSAIGMYFFNNYYWNKESEKYNYS